MKIENKRKFFELWEAGVLGNRTRLWRDPREAYRFGLERDLARARLAEHWGTFKGTEIGFRELRKPGTAGAGKWEKVPWLHVLETAERWKEDGLDFIMDDACPNELTTLCGEVIQTERGLEGTLAVRPRMGMRSAINNGLLLPRTPLTTRVLLEHFMDASSREDLRELLDQYPDSAIEFSCFSVNVGVFPHRNTLFWEVRNY
jgi:hypothetical protein